MRTPAQPTLTSYDTWCRAYSGTLVQKYETFLPTFTGSGINGLGTKAYTSLRYALEHFVQPPWTTNLTDTNIQSFRVIVESTN